MGIDPKLCVQAQNAEYEGNRPSSLYWHFLNEELSSNPLVYLRMTWGSRRLAHPRDQAWYLWQMHASLRISGDSPWAEGGLTDLARRMCVEVETRTCGSEAALFRLSRRTCCDDDESIQIEWCCLVYELAKIDAWYKKMKNYWRLHPCFSLCIVCWDVLQCVHWSMQFTGTETLPTRYECMSAELGAEFRKFTWKPWTSICRLKHYIALYSLESKKMCLMTDSKSPHDIYS